MALTKISTDGVKDNAITKAKIPADQIETSELANDAVTEDKLANSINTAIAANTAKDLTALSASNLTSGTVPDARFPATLPAASAANLTSIPAANITGDLPAISGANLTNLNIPVNSEWSFGSTGITTTKNLGINTSTVDNYETVGAANSFRGIYIGDGSLIFNARLDNPNGYYIGTGRNALNAGPITLGSTMTLDGAWVIV